MVPITRLLIDWSHRSHSNITSCKGMGESFDLRDSVTVVRWVVFEL